MTAPQITTRRDPMPGIAGKNVLVSGGSSGIGQAIAVRFAEHGANVAINYLTQPEEAHDTEEQVHACVRRVQQEGVRDVLVQGDVSSEDDSSRDFDRVLAVNLRGSFMCAREALRHFIEHDKPGSIVNVSSVHQLIPKPGYLGYSTSKGGMQNLTRTLALEYAGRGIRVNGIGPGATVTPTRWPAWRASSPATWPPTSPGRRSSSTAG